jgi:general stress protein YciG
MNSDEQSQLEFQREMGRSGGRRTAEKHGSEYMKELGRRGGLAKRIARETVGEAKSVAPKSERVLAPRVNSAKPAVDNPEDPLFDL